MSLGTQFVTLEDLVKFQPNPNFGMWALESTSKKDSGKLKDIDLSVKCLIEMGLASDKFEALQYLDELSKDYSKSRFVGADFDGSTHSMPMRQLRVEVGDKVDSEYALFRMFGVLTHKFAPQLLAGMIPYRLTPEYQKELDSWLQPGLFDPVHLRDRLFPEPAPLGQSLQFLKGGRYLYDIEYAWKQAMKILKKRQPWQKRCRAMRTQVHELEKLLRPIFGSHMNELLRIRGMSVTYGEYLAGLTLVIWASMVINAAGSKSMLILPELPVMHAAHRLGFRRVDGLVIDSVGGKRPTKSQIFILRKCIDAANSGEYRSPSVSALLMMLSRYFGAPVRGHMIDFKSAVGDFAGQEDYMISRDQCPLTSHEDQMTGYILQASLDRHLLNGGNGEENPWDHDDALTDGTLQYLLATSKPYDVPIYRTPTEQQKHFINTIVRRLPYAREKGIIREMSHMFGNHLLHLRKENSYRANKAITRYLAPPKEAWLFPSMESEAQPVQHIIEQHRQYADDHQIVEIVMGRKKLLYRMHLDRLYKLIEDGTLDTRNFHDGKGGFVACLNPEHQDTTPSMHINLEKGFFKCYSCVGFYGTFDRYSAQRVDGRVLQLQTFEAIRKRNQHQMGVVIPPRLHKLFEKTQELLSEHFTQSPGARYLEQERGLSSDLAYQYGAGYGTDYVIEALGEAGFTYQELVDAGLINFSPTIPRDKSLIELLTNPWGYKPEEVSLEKLNKKTKKMELHLPYFPMRQRVTFPLKLHGFITNFYGRATYPKARVPHYKLAVTGGASTHGGFNLECLESDFEEIVMVESIIDALSLMSSGLSNVLGFIGITNYAVLEAAMNSGKHLTFGLDNDLPGRLATIKVRKWMRKANYRQPVGNFSKSFFPDYRVATRVKDYQGPGPRIKDFNNWWINTSISMH